MGRTGWVVAVLLGATGAVAQPTRKSPVKPASPAPPTAAATAPAEAAVRFVPPDEPGWTVVEVPGGYYRYRLEPGEAAGEGGVTVTPAERPTSAPRQPAAAPLVAPPVEGPAPLAVDCERERGLLNQRLWELRGVAVEPAGANVLADNERPLLPSAWAFVPGVGPGLASVASTAAAYDGPTRDRLHAFARCLERGAGR